MIRKLSKLVLMTLCLASTSVHAEENGSEKPVGAAVAGKQASHMASVFDLLHWKTANEADESFRKLRRERLRLIKEVDETKTQLASLRDGLTRKEQSLQRLKEQLDAEEWETFDSVPPSAKADRDSLSKEIETLKSNLGTLGGSEKEKAEQQLRDLRSRFESLNSFIIRREEDAKRRSSQIQERRKNLEVQIKKLSEEIDREQTNGQRLVQTINDNLTRQSAIEDDLNDVLKIEMQRNDFKTTIALFFAGLVALVIGGFFVLSYRDNIVRQAIFSGESGIQFLTLFSVVIAIILFGIIGILESKELAALLGGLSGYILGRVTTATSRQPLGPSATPNTSPPLAPTAPVTG